MHDIKSFRADGVVFSEALARRNPAFRVDAAEMGAFDLDWRAAVAAQQSAQSRRNALAKEIGQGKRTGADTAALEAEATHIRGEMERLDATVAQLDAEVRKRLVAFPNFLDSEVPDGANESDNLELKRHGTPPDLPFIPKQHFELGETLGLMDFESAAKLSGSRFTVLRGPLARLERALGQFMLDMHTSKHGYEEFSVPTLVNGDAMFGTGQLPKFADDSFRTTDNRWLIPTAEVPLTNLNAGEIIPEATLPLRRTALTECYRSEAGSAGRDTRGMLRQHQFRKVELVSIVHPDHSDAEHERMTGCAEAVLEALELPYRRMLLCAGDTGFSAARTHDLEVWLPGQGTWREISSCSNTRAFQARRMNARFRASDGKTVAHVHTLNGSGVAVGRALIAVLENCQQSDGSIRVPAVLIPYMGGQEIITRS